MSHLPLSPELRAKLRELLEIDPTSPSGLRWKVGRRGKARAGSPAGHLHKSNGYWEVRLDGKSYLAHRLIWVLVHDEDPSDHQIDHIDGKRGNNDPANLRLATHGENQHNEGLRRSNTSGHKGVSRQSRCVSWLGRVKLHGKEITKLFSDSKYGSCEAALASAAAWAAAMREKLHGDFARHE